MSHNSIFWEDIESNNKTTRKQVEGNILCVIGKTKYMWMVDHKTEMLQAYYDECIANITKVNIQFQLQHGRRRAVVPEDQLTALDPQLIIIGNAPSVYIYYGDFRMIIAQNTAVDIFFINDDGYVHIYSQHKIMYHLA